MLSHDLRRLKALLTYFAVSHKFYDQNKSKSEVSFSAEFRSWGKEHLYIYNLHPIAKASNNSRKPALVTLWISFANRKLSKGTLQDYTFIAEEVYWQRPAGAWEVVGSNTLRESDFYLLLLPSNTTLVTSRDPFSISTASQPISMLSENK